jgi:hypothetical protein
MIAHTITIKLLLATHGGLASLPRASLHLPDPLHQYIYVFFFLALCKLTNIYCH